MKGAVSINRLYSVIGIYRYDIVLKVSVNLYTSIWGQQYLAFTKHYLPYVQTTMSSRNLKSV